MLTKPIITKHTTIALYITYYSVKLIVNEKILLTPQCLFGKVYISLKIAAVLNFKNPWKNMHIHFHITSMTIISVAKPVLTTKRSYRIQKIEFRSPNVTSEQERHLTACVLAKYKWVFVCREFKIISGYCPSLWKKLS